MTYVAENLSVVKGEQTFRIKRPHKRPIVVPRGDALDHDSILNDAHNFSDLLQRLLCIDFYDVRNNDGGVGHFVLCSWYSTRSGRTAASFIFIFFKVIQGLLLDSFD